MKIDRKNQNCMILLPDVREYPKRRDIRRIWSWFVVATHGVTRVLDHGGNHTMSSTRVGLTSSQTIVRHPGISPRYVGLKWLIG
jgi:hypothetical protein